MTPEKQIEYRKGLAQALKVGGQDLNKKGGSALDCVEAAVRCLEDFPLFNAG